MKRKTMHRPAALTLLGIYVRHICRTLGVEPEVVSPLVELLPMQGIISVQGPFSGPLERLADPALWETIDTAAAGELGQPIKSVVAGDVVWIDTPRA
jgi:hypothetical protein